ncbi:MAG: hypothetical protein DHS20C01_03450 [marine bacterium B5-7]|nr:MAG: hypothetical protein DHS20C01_03450 [marine bacterium B5-7]
MPENHHCEDPIWSLDYIFAIAGGTRIVSTDPCANFYPKPLFGLHSKRRQPITGCGFLGIAIATTR